MLLQELIAHGLKFTYY
eukprot:gene22390-28987_t